MTSEEAVELQQAHYVLVAQEALSKSKIETATSAVYYEKALAEKRREELVLQRVQNALRPSIVLGATIVQEGDRYVATFSNLNVYGETPEQAFQNFDELWVGREKNGDA